MISYDFPVKTVKLAYFRATKQDKQVCGYYFFKSAVKNKEDLLFVFDARYIRKQSGKSRQ